MMKKMILNFLFVDDIASASMFLMAVAKEGLVEQIESMQTYISIGFGWST